MNIILLQQLVDSYSNTSSQFLNMSKSASYSGLIPQTRLTDLESMLNFSKAQLPFIYQPCLGY